MTIVPKPFSTCSKSSKDTMQFTFRLEATRHGSYQLEFVWITCLKFL